MKRLVVGLAVGGAAVALAVSPAGGAVVDTFLPPTLDLAEGRSIDGDLEALPRVRATPPPHGRDAQPPGSKDGDELAAAAAAATSLPAGLRVTSQQVIADDPILASLLHGTDYSIARFGPWTNEGSTQVVGTISELRLAEPIEATDVVLPGVRYNAAGTDYRPVDLHLTIEKARSLTVLVNLQAGRVVSIQPGFDADVSEAPATQHFPRPEDGGA